MRSISQLLISLRQATAEGSLAQTNPILSSLQGLQSVLESQTPTKPELMEIQATLRDLEPKLQETGRFLSTWQMTVSGPTYGPNDGRILSEG